MVGQINGITIGFGWTVERCNEFLNPYHHNNSLLTKALYYMILISPLGPVDTKTVN